MAITRVAVVGSASGSGKTTLARRLAARIRCEAIEYDAFQHGPGWTRVPAPEIVARIAPLLERDAWTIDAVATAVLGPRVLERAHIVVWIDLPPWVWLPRLIRRSARRWVTREELWNGNRETLRGIVWDEDSVLRHAIRAYFRRREAMEAQLAPHPVVRLRSPSAVEAFVAFFPGHAPAL